MLSLWLSIAELIKLGPIDKYEAKVTIEKGGSTLSWEFSTKGYDIGFAVLYSAASDSEDSVSQSLCSVFLNEFEFITL